MGWAPNHPPDTHTPVDDLVDALSAKLTGVHSTCDVFKGKDTKCCEGLLSCFVTFENLLTSIKIVAIADQNIYRACREVNSGLSTLLTCKGVEHKSMSCARADSDPEIKSSTDTILVNLYSTYNDQCGDLPPQPETTKRPPTTSTTTTSAPTTTPKPASTTRDFPAGPTTPEITTPTVHNASSTNGLNQTEVYPTVTESFTTPSQNVNGSFAFRDSVTSKGTGPDVLTIVSATTGSLVFLCVIGILVLMLIRKYKSRDKNGSNGSLGSNKRFLGGLFEFSRSSNPASTTEEIYEEIDETFMDAVYRQHNKQEAPKVKKRVGSHTQINACYGQNDMPDVIISANHQNVSPDDDKQIPVPHSDEAKTSFTTEQSRQISQRYTSHITHAKLMLPNQHFIVSHPGFSGIHQEPTLYEEYVNISGENDVTSNVYDRAEFIRSNEQGSNQAHMYDSVHHYGNYGNRGYVRNEDYKPDERDRYEVAVGWNAGRDLSMVY